MVWILTLFMLMASPFLTAGQVLAADEVVADKMASEEMSSDLACLAKASYFEARGEGQHSMTAVASVIMNRVASEDFPNTVCDVVRGGGEEKGCQFSWYCDGEPDIAEEAELWQEAKQVARKVLANKVADPTGGALFFHGESIGEPWTKERERLVALGGFVFYR